MGRKKDVGTDTAAGDAESTDESLAAATGRSHTTAPKGRPTPKRSEASTGRQAKRGPVAPAPMTGAEARARRKAVAGAKLSSEQRKAQKMQRREAMAERRERMMAGNEAYLLSRDQGPVRRLARDVVDARRNLLGLFMPSALGLLFFGMTAPQVQLYVYPAMMGLMVVMALDGILLARKVTKLADAKFPDNVESRAKLGFYAVGRASQLRRMRAPRPQVNRGDRVD